MTRTVLFFLAAAAMMAQGGFRGPGRYEIYSPLSKKVLDMDRNDQRTVIQFERRQTPNQAWDVSDAGGGYVYIRNAMNGNALAVRDDKNSSPLVAEPFSSSGQQQWRIESGEDSTAILINRNGKAIDIPYGSTDNGVKINSYNRNNEVNQRWQFHAVAGGFGNNQGRYENQDRYGQNENARQNRGRGRGRGGSNSRYDDPGSVGAPVDGQRNSDGGYYDQRDRTYRMDGDGACFYRNRDFGGEAVCVSMQAGRPGWNTPQFDIGSVRFFGRARAAQLFDRDNYQGNAVEITGDERDLNRAGRLLKGAPRSIRVY